jgi:hypothetical protein
VEVTDAEGVTINDAQIVSHAWMTNMNMGVPIISAAAKGQGMYLVRINLFMAGPWMIALSMQDNDFAPLHQTVLVQVPSESAALSQPVQAHPLKGDDSCALAMASRVTA